MSVKVRAFEKKVTFEVADEEPMASVRNPDAQKFVPQQVIVVFEQGVLIDIWVAGPLLNAKGVQLKRWGLTGFNSDDLEEDDPLYPMPTFVREATQLAFHV